MKEIDEAELANRPQRYVLVDTSLLMLMIEGVAVLDQLEEFGKKCVVTTSVLKELERHLSKGGRKARAARLALEIVKRKCFHLPTRGSKIADEEIKEIALEYRVAVATADIRMRKGLLRRIPTFYYRESQARVEYDSFFY